MVPLPPPYNSAVQKHHYRSLRGRLMTLLGAVDSKCGGFRGRGTGLASLGVRGFLADTRSYRISAHALFVDLKSGFYTLVMEFVVRLQTAGDDIDRILDSISASAQLESALLAMMAEPAIVERYLGDGHLGALFTEAHTNIWFVVDGRRDVARAVKGSRPGVASLTSSSVLPLPPPSGELKTSFPMPDTFGRPPMLPPCFLPATSLGRPPGPVRTPGPPPSAPILRPRILLVPTIPASAASCVAMSVSLAP